MTEVPSDSNAFNILSACRPQKGAQLRKREEVISSVTIENDDKALCVSPSVSVHGYRENGRKKEARVIGLSP